MTYMLLPFTHQILHNNTFYNTKLLMRLHTINAQLIFKPQLIYIRFKIIRYYHVKITGDKFHGVLL